MSRYENGDNPFQVVKIFMSRGTYGLLKEKSKSGVPISKLIQIATDNELSAPAPFNFECPMPQNVFVELAYIQEAQLIAKYMVKFPSGTGRDQLMLCRRDIGIENKQTFMLAYRELLKANVIEEIPVPKKAKFNYPVGYRYVRLVAVDRSALLKRKRRMLDKENARLAAEEAEFDRLKQDKEKQYGVEK